MLNHIIWLVLFSFPLLLPHIDYIQNLTTYSLTSKSGTQGGEVFVELGKSISLEIKNWEMVKTGTEKWVTDSLCLSFHLQLPEKDLKCALL